MTNRIATVLCQSAFNAVRRSAGFLGRVSRFEPYNQFEYRLFTHLRGALSALFARFASVVLNPAPFLVGM